MGVPRLRCAGISDGTAAGTVVLFGLDLLWCARPAAPLSSLFSISRRNLGPNQPRQWLPLSHNLAAPSCAPSIKQPAPPLH